MTRARRLALLATLLAAGTARGEAPPAAPEGVPPPGAVASPCLACHEDHHRTEVRSRHAPAASGQCAACHEVAPAHLEDGEPRHVKTAPVERTCVGCHPAVLGRGRRHGALDEGGGCTACHDPHGSAEPALLVRPLAGLCAGCHETPAATVAPGTEAAGVHGRGEACLACHAVHTAPGRKLLRREPPAACLGCHDERLTVGKRVVGDIGWKVERAGAVHGVPSWKDESQGRNVARDCLACHLAHPRPGGAAMLKAAGNALCFSCHARARFPALAGGRASHPGSGHPVEGGPDPLRPARAFGCVSCHEPHGSSQPELLRYRPLADAPEGSRFCGHCHPETLRARPPVPPWHEEEAREGAPRR